MGSKWLDSIVEKLSFEADMNLKDQFSVLQARYYPVSKRASAYFVIYLKCKKCCDLFYTLKILKKPNSGESIIFCVDMTTEHGVCFSWSMEISRFKYLFW